MVRLMVTSSAYRQSSLPRPELDAVDPDNRLVARQSRLPARRRADSRQRPRGERPVGRQARRRHRAALSAGGLLRAAQFPRARVQPIDAATTSSAAPCTSTGSGSSCTPGCWRSTPRRGGMHGRPRPLQHAHRRAGAAERSIVRRSGPRAGRPRARAVRQQIGPRQDRLGLANRPGPRTGIRPKSPSSRACSTSIAPTTPPTTPAPKPSSPSASRRARRISTPPSSPPGPPSAACC